MKNKIMLLGDASCLAMLAGCITKTSEGGDKAKVTLSAEDKQTLSTAAGKFNALLKSGETMNVFKKAMQKSDKEAFLLKFLSPTLETNEQTELVKSILHQLFKSEGSASSGDTQEFSVSAPVSQLIGKLSTNLKNEIRTAYEKKIPTNKLIDKLKQALLDFKDEAQSSTTLSFDEMRALVAAAEFQHQTIESEVMALDS